MCQPGRSGSRLFNPLNRTLWLTAFLYLLPSYIAIAGLPGLPERPIVVHAMPGSGQEEMAMRVFYRLVMDGRMSRCAALSTSAAHLPSSEESGDRCGEHSWQWPPWL